MTVALAAKGVTAGYQSIAAIFDVDLEVSTGELVLIAGPNGAGKTTTVRALAGEIMPLSGEVECEGISVRQPVYERVRNGLGLVPEERAVFKTMTCLDNLKLGRGSVAGALEHFPELEKRLNVNAGLLSGGEQQMLTLGRVIAAQPKVILADELSLGLAPIVVNRLLRALRSAADRGSAVLLVEQHVRVALDMVDRAYFLKQGRVVAQGGASEFRDSDERLRSLYL
jgi:branched-chain amino acid transport system ATP-binding protein